MPDDVAAALARFEIDERARLGLDGAPRAAWVETMTDATFKATERAEVTLLVAGLTVAHDHFIEGAVEGLGYRVKALDCPDNAALTVGKEFGNRGQCNPTYFTVGNLVKFLTHLRDDEGMTREEIVAKYLFVTAGACGPCRFGMYVTEYRKALRDAGFDGFRVLLFQQSGGLSQATGDDLGLEFNPPFFIALVKSLVAGDVINALGYRIRPYETERGATDRALERAKREVYDALRVRGSVLLALARSRKHLAAVKVDRTAPKPRVAVIGEFWAMTTEGDGNYRLQRFLEGEGAEVDVQLVTAWLLYSLWECKNDTAQRRELRGADTSYYGLGKLGTFGVRKRELTLFAAEWVTRGAFQLFANVAGLHGYHLPDMEAVADLAQPHYHNDLRGGEGHMEVGKLIQNVTERKAHMTLSVKPFGCMPSAGVSDGVQTLIAERYPGTIYCPVETSGDGAVNFYSRVQMYLFKARAAAEAELAATCAEHGVGLDEVRALVARTPRLASALHKSPHAAAGTASDLVAEVAPLLRFSRAERARQASARAARAVVAGGRAAPGVALRLARAAATGLPRLVTMLAEDAASLAAG